MNFSIARRQSYQVPKSGHVYDAHCSLGMSRLLPFHRHARYNRPHENETPAGVSTRLTLPVLRDALLQHRPPSLGLPTCHDANNWNSFSLLSRTIRFCDMAWQCAVPPMATRIRLKPTSANC